MITILKYNNLKRFAAIILIALSLGSCNSWFDVDNEDGTSTKDQYLKNSEAFQNALTGIYTDLRKNSIYGKELSVSMIEFMGQNFVPNDAQSIAFSNYDYQSADNKVTISNVWQDTYAAIASINLLIEDLEQTNVIFPTGQKDMMRGELYGLRGALHFDLLRLFNQSYQVNPQFVGIPYMTQFGKSVSQPQSSELTLGYIINDLKHSAELLKVTDPILTGQTITTPQVGVVNNRLRTFQLNYYAAIAVLARVYLYMGDYINALEYATIPFDHVDNLATDKRVFYFFNPGNFDSDYSFSREQIFGISSMPTGLTSVSEEMFETKKIAVSQNFTTVYSNTADTRYRTWFELQSDGVTYIMSKKYSRESLLSGYISTTTSSNNITLPVRIPYIKLGEMCLIAAEALNAQGQMSEAAEWIIKMQQSKNVTDIENLKIANALNQSVISDEIAKEYEREFWGEGQLFFYRKRINANTITSYNGALIQMDANKYTLPIPDKGISVK